MKSFEATGRTVEEAIENALAELGVKRDEAEIEVLEEPNRGLFGILGSKHARVRVDAKIDAEEIAREFLYEVLDKMGIEVDINGERKGEYYYLSLTGNSLGIIIGRRGETLDALQYLVNLVVNKKLSRFGERARVIIDAEGYRVKREKTLVRLAEKIAERVKQTGSRVVLEPMNPQERRVIHTALQGDREVETFSEGTEPFRKVVVAPKGIETQTQ